MKQDLHVVLGAAGSVGQSVVEELQFRKFNIRAVVRTKSIKGVETVHADLLDLNQAICVIEGASYVYLCIGLPYNAKIWKNQWPKIMENVITACEKAQARLIFLDNVYMYGPPPLKVPFTEEHLKEPTSSKGKTRKIILDMLLHAHKMGRIKAVIGRSADFYGPNVKNSPLYISFIERIIKGKSPQSLGKTDIKHTYSHVKDNGKALVALALDESTYGQEWHLPVSEPLTTDQIVDEINHLLKSDFKATIVPRFMLKIMSIFISPVKEISELLYQNDDTYIMSDKKFRDHFPEFKATEFKKGISEMIFSFTNSKDQR